MIRISGISGDSSVRVIPETLIRPNGRQAIVRGNRANAPIQGRFTERVLDRIITTAILAGILSLSAYSLYVILRHYGAAPIAAISASVALDLVALNAARYALKYARTCQNGAFPRAVVFIFGILAAFVQTLHARIGNEPLAMLAFWSSLPIAAIITYEIHIRWENRVSLNNSGHIFDVAKPSFGLYAWLRFRRESQTGLDVITLDRIEAITAHHRARFTVTNQRAKAIIPPSPRPEIAAPKTNASKASHSARITDIREWAVREGKIRPEQRHGRLSRHIHNEYAKAQSM
jgi:hypothetical protein